MVKRFREDPNGDESAGKRVRGTSTLPKVFDQPNGSKLELVWKGDNRWGPRKHPSLFSESHGVLMATPRRFDWTKIRSSKMINGNLMRHGRSPLWLDFEGTIQKQNSKWKRNFYTRYATYEERISHRPEQLSQQEWVQLMEFWDTPEHQAISKRNRANRAKQITKHAAGRISFPQLEEIMSQEAGAPPSLGDLFVRTHTSSQTHDALDDQSREYNGRGVTPTSYFGSRLSSHNRVNDLESRLAEMQRVAQEKEEERRLEIEEIKRQAQEKDEQ
ncbi:hypothetical protein IFM89_014227, partial [Coptis chinensis]